MPRVLVCGAKHEDKSRPVDGGKKPSEAAKENTNGKRVK